MNTGDFIVRYFHEQDLDQVMRINEECLPENYSAYFYRDLYKKYPKTFIVAEADGSIQGYIMSRIERGFSKLGRLTPARLCHVVSVAVRKTYRRQGIGTKLLIEVMKNGLKEYKASECYLEVRITNEPAVNLYKRLGFDIVKRNYGYYLDGEDAWVMAISIKDLVSASI